MKKIAIIFFAALAAVACNRNNTTPEVTGAELFATNDAAKTQLNGMNVLWEEGDAINVFAQGESYKFATAQSGASVKFKGGNVTIDNTTYALYPYVDAATFASDIFTTTVSTAEQKVKKGTFTSKMNLAVAQCDNAKKATFTSVGALLKFRLSQAGADTLKRIEIKANGGEAIAIEGKADITYNSGNPTIAAASGAKTSDVIVLTPESGSFVSNDTYYVWVVPGNYAGGITVKLVTKTLMEGEKTSATALNIARNSIVDLGDIENITYKKKGETKTLTFDFSVCPEGWPSGEEEYKSTDHTEKTHEYVLDKVTYTFSSATCLGISATSKRAICWGYDGTNAQEYFVMQSERYFGLPAIEGWKLITVKFTQACATPSKETDIRKACITTALATQSQQSTVYAGGGEPIVVRTNNTEYAFYLTDTQANKRYYLAPTSKATGFATMTLVYEKVNQ